MTTMSTHHDTPDDSPAARERAAHARVPYQGPAALSDAAGRSTRVPATVALVDSYRTQQHVWQQGDVRMSVRLDPATVRRDDAPPPKHDEGTRWLITAWNPWTRPLTLDENEHATRTLIADVETFGGTVLAVAATTPPERTWLEDTLVVEGLLPDVVLALARGFGQPALTALTVDTWTVVPTGITDLPVLTGCPLTSTEPSSTCPMRTDNEPDGRCLLHGGPWTSSSIHASALWRAHRNLLLSRLGCTPCRDGQNPTLGPFGDVVGATRVPGTHLVVASRYGGYVWR